MRSLIAACLTSAVVTLFLVETVLEGPYVSAKNFARQSLKQTQNKPTPIEAGYDTCEIPETKTIASGSTVIIGHAYGSPHTSDYFISAKVERFIRDQATQLDAVIFSGDVFKVPSAARWQRLTVLAAEVDVPFHIAPGNQDVGHGENANRDIWNQSPFRLTETPVTPLAVSGFGIFLEDSVISNWNVLPDVLVNV